jgi:hypothetical protein
LPAYKITTPSACSSLPDNLFIAYCCPDVVGRGKSCLLLTAYCFLLPASSLLITHYSPAYRSPGACAKATASAHGQSLWRRAAGRLLTALCFFLPPGPDFYYISLMALFKAKPPLPEMR